MSLSLNSEPGLFPGYDFKYYHAFGSYSLERQSGIVPKYYVDANDAISIVKGAHSFYGESMRFDEVEFSNLKGRLAQFFIAEKMLNNTAQLLPPHQSEFANHLAQDFGITNNNLVTPSEFVDTVIHYLESENMGGSKFSEMTFDERRKLRLDGLDEFKLVCSLHPFNWNKRLSNIFRGDDKIFEINDVRVDINVALKSKLYHPIKSALDKQRPGNRLNNLNDAVALCCLAQELLTQHPTNDELCLPMLLDSNGTLGQAIKSAKKERDFVRMIRPKRNGSRSYRFTSIKTPEYFQIAAIFSDVNNQQLSEIDIISDEDEIRQQFVDFLNEYYSLTNSGMASNYHQKIQEIADFEERLQDYVVVKFYRNYLATSKFEKKLNYEYDTNQKITSIVNLIGKATDEEVLDQDTNSIRIQLSQSTKVFMRQQETWDEMQKKMSSFVTHVLQHKEKNKYNRSINAIQDFGLFRFHLPKDVLTRVKLELKENTGIFTHDKKLRENAINKFVSLYFDNLVSIENSDLKYILAVLWVFEGYDKIQDLRAKGSDFSDTLILLCSNLKSSRTDFDLVSRQFHALELWIEKGNFSDLEKAKMFIGIAYAYFTCWDKTNPKARLGTAVAKSPCTHLNNIGQKALDYSSLAVKTLEKVVESSKAGVDHDLAFVLAYSYNIKLYYIIETLPDKDFAADYKNSKGQINSSFIGLKNWKEDQVSKLESRFLDTESRLNFRLAVNEKIRAEKKELLKEAKDLNKTAIAISLGNPEIGRFKDKIKQFNHELNQNLNE